MSGSTVESNSGSPPPKKADFLPMDQVITNESGQTTKINNSSLESNSRLSPKPVPRLTCEACRTRKIKCNKDVPCSSCTRSGIPCVPTERHRLGRGRSKISQKTEMSENKAHIRSISAIAPKLLYNVDDTPRETPQPFQLLGSGSRLCLGLKPSTSQIPPDSEQHLPIEIQQILCQVYLQQVDPVFKVLHWPSLRACLEERKPYLDYDESDPAVQALASAVYYAAASSLTEAQSVSIFGSSKQIAVRQCQSQCEAALNHTDLTVTEDLTVLQAFTLFLISTRLHDRSRRVWTLLSIALRIAQALSIHVETPSVPAPPFEKEMRRRAWFAICLLDVQSALDQATEAMVPQAWLQVNPPTNINDADLWPGFSGILQDSNSFTDMSFTLMVCSAQFAIAYLNMNPRDDPEVSKWTIRQARVELFKEKSASLLKRCTPDLNHFHWYTMQVAEYLRAAMQLVAIRPLRYLPKSGAPPMGPGKVLKLSVDILQKSQALLNDPRGHLWYWFDQIFIEWHALAVAISEICALKEKDLIQQHWPLVEMALGNFNNLVANSKNVKLWKPIEELITRTRYTLNHSFFHANSPEDSLSTLEDTLPQDLAEFLASGLPLDPDADPPLPLDMDFTSELNPVALDGWAIWEEFVSQNPTIANTTF
ncbi:hypothetical protein B0O99DRAFT_300010 [Bisporella sp. PMI_857]|nr:hypothetical protein B0O99DRAFT_300010 [Bisporella sp. PMI_857]